MAAGLLLGGVTAGTARADGGGSAQVLVLADPASSAFKPGESTSHGILVANETGGEVTLVNADIRPDDGTPAGMFSVDPVAGTPPIPPAASAAVTVRVGAVDSAAEYSADMVVAVRVTGADGARLGQVQHVPFTAGAAATPQTISFPEDGVVLVDSTFLSLRHDTYTGRVKVRTTAKCMEGDVLGTAQLIAAGDTATATLTCPSDADAGQVNAQLMVSQLGKAGAT